MLLPHRLGDVLLEDLHREIHRGAYRPQHHAGRTYRRRMVGKGRWRSQLWGTSSSRAHASWCSTLSTKRISSGSHTGSDPDEGRTMRWMLCRWRSPVASELHT